MSKITEQFCKCPECKGNGRIVCPECNGTGGNYHATVADIEIPPGHKNANELEALRDDAKRVNDQAKRLASMNPAYSKNYERQRVATLDQITKQAEKLL